MEPFRVICETCRSRLKVRDAAAIGQIHACPKCGSMVLIKPPADWADTIAPPARVLLASSGKSAPTGASQAERTSGYTVESADFAIDLSASTAAVTFPSEMLSEEPVTAVAASTGSYSPLWWSAAGLLAMLAGAAITYALWPESGETTSPVTAAATPLENSAEESTEATVETVKPTESDPKKADPTEGQPATVAATPPPIEAAKPVAGQPAKPTDPTTAAVDVGASPQPPQPVNETAAAVATTPKPVDSAPVRPDTPPLNANATSHVLKFDPLDFDPDHLSLSTRPAAATDAAIPPSTASIPAETSSDASSEASNSALDHVPNARNILPPPAANQAVNVRRGPATAVVPSPPHTTQHLSLRVKSLQLNEATLASFVHTVSNMASAPIVLDPIILELNGQSPRSTVSVSAVDTTLEKIVRDTLAGLRLELVERGGALGVDLANSDERKAVDFDVKDLAEGADASGVAKLVEAFVAPNSWRSAGGTGTIEVQGGSLRVDHTLTARREVLIFCERLRLARSKTLRSKFPVDLLSIESPYIKLSSKLRQPTTFTFLAWSRLVDVVNEWQEMTGITMLVDWSALREVNLTPTSPIACSTIDRPWTEALDGVLEPLGLAWWAADAHTICITSQDALGQIERVEFYVAPPQDNEQTANTNAFVDSLRNEVAARPNKHTDHGNPRFHLDEASGRVIVRANPDVHRFLSERLSGSPK